MGEFGVERVVWARRLGNERSELHITFSTPLDQFEYVTITTIHDQYDSATGQVGPLQWYVNFHDPEGQSIRLAHWDNESEGEAFAFAEGIGIPKGEWLRVDELVLDEDRALPRKLLEQLA